MQHPVRKPLRLPGYDYSEPGMYFVTICTRNMECRFGEIVEGQMLMNRAGIMVENDWHANANRYGGIVMDSFIVMPNHVHAIIFLETTPDADVLTHFLSRVVQTFKSITTVNYGRGVRSGVFPAFDRTLWQRGFHEHIIRNDRSLEAIRAYRVYRGPPGTVEAKRRVGADLVSARRRADTRSAPT